MMQVRLWGTRGSLATPGHGTERYGGNTSCVEVRGADGTILVLDAGTGIRPLGGTIAGDGSRVDLLLTHLHMDHIQGLGFFAPLFNPAMEVHIWGPASTTLTLSVRLARYLSPPLFPVRLRDLPCALELHEVPCGDFEVGQFHISSALVCHPNPTVGYRIEDSEAAVTYLPDHEPALGLHDSYLSPDWTSGYNLAADADLLIHDAQYTDEEYARSVGWGHSSVRQAFGFARLADVKHFVPFHHDPSHDDSFLDRLMNAAVDEYRPDFAVTPGTESSTFALPEGRLP
jgi:phosphoribosyl 1,2-cyclic phosphodiesterase